MESDSEDLSPIEKLNQQHKKEKKDLQAKIQALKKTAIKGDKKKKKEVQDEIAKLESDLQAKHVAELAAVEVTKEEEPVAEIADDLSKSSLSDAPKLSKAQKRKIKKDVSNKEREQRIAEQEVENLTGLRHVETEKIKEKLKKMELMLFEIPSDGDCLYAAVEHGNIRAGGPRLGIPTLRRITAEHIQNNQNDYLPFLTDPATGGPLDEAQFADYCYKISSTRQWGGQVELDALTQVIKKALVVVQAEGHDLVMGEEYGQSGKIVLAYHRHMYRLGEHYNSVQPYVEPTDI